jgi:hypothetical protein
LSRLSGDDPDGTTECDCRPKVEKVPTHPDEEQGPENQNHGRNPEWHQDPQVVCLGNFISG